MVLLAILVDGPLLVPRRVSAAGPSSIDLPSPITLIELCFFLVEKILKKIPSWAPIVNTELSVKVGK